ncbi:exoglucanase 1 [Apiospora arundinis]|uniref:Glucanase n=1 Tax=Apiospora arundinis TaxID=335852 RepID=A0ABR2JNU7_9PEZI
MLSKIALLGGLLASTASAQQVGKQTTETHPKMSWQKCSSGGSCQTVSGEVTIDANWRWLHETSGTTNCYTGNEWDSSICSDAKSCSQKCAVDGADYSSTYGIQTSGNALTLKFVTKGQYSTNIGSRTYLMNGADKYQTFKLLGNEFTFDVDLSKLGCGLNGALYFVSMDEDGGKSKYSANKAGAKYGTGYCDAQCPRDLKFIDGEANSDKWQPSTNDENAGVGARGSCCSEMDIWEANSISTAFTPHPCKTVGQKACQGDNCGGTYSSDRYAGDCDPDGCDFNSYRQGVKDFYGPGMTVDTTKKFTVVTQFIGSGSNLEAIRRFYVQGGKTIPNSESTIEGNGGNQIDEKFCSSQKTAFGDTDDFKSKGGLQQMAKALAGNMVLVMSLWDDHYANMLWLDSSYPLDKDASTPGVGRGTCDTSSGVPADVEGKQGSSQVIYSNIKFGPINSTFKQ